MGVEWIIAIAAAVVIAGLISYFVIKHMRCSSGQCLTVDHIVGQKCTVTETIDNFAGCGQVKVKGQLWSARGFFDDDIFERGENLRIVAIEGVKAVCKKD